MGKRFLETSAGSGPRTETGGIKLMRHHLPVLVKDRLGPRNGFLGSAMYGARRRSYVLGYGLDHVKSRESMLRSLDPAAVVELVDDKTDGRMNIDVVCESECPYRVICASGKSPIPAMPWFVRPLFRELIYSDQERRRMLREIFPPGDYVLEDLIERARPYFNR